MYVYIYIGTGDIYVNGKRYCEYFSELDNRWEVCAPFFHTHTLMDMDMIAIVSGGGKSGQAGAIKNAAAKALQAMDRKKYRPLLKASECEEEREKDEDSSIIYAIVFMCVYSQCALFYLHSASLPPLLSPSVLLLPSPSLPPLLRILTEP